MAKGPGEVLHEVGDRLHEAAGFIMGVVDATWEHVDREGGPIDTMYVKALKLNSWILKHTIPATKEENNE